MKTCKYIEIGHDSYGTNWKTECGRTVRCEAPIDVGFSFDPLPNEDGKFCPYCDGEIVLKVEKAKKSLGIDETKQ